MKKVENEKRNKIKAATEKQKKEKKKFLPAACSCLTLTSETERHYWFRTCDIETRIWEEGAHVVQQAAGGKIEYSNGKEERSRYSFIGITYNSLDTWLLDGVNEEGLTGGLLMLYEGTSVENAEEERQGYVGMELVTKLLSSCKNVDEIKKAVKQLQILDIPINGEKFTASMHYFFLDRWGDEVVLEAIDEENPGILQVYKKEEILGVMTNSPPYREQVGNLEWFLANSTEMKQGIKGQALTKLRLDGRVIKADKEAEHLSITATFPASYSSYDRFLRLAVMKALNDSGNHWTDEEMLAKGSNLMNVVMEPENKGVFHYTRVETDGTIVGQKESYTQYLIMYDIEEKCFFLKVFDRVSWVKYTLKQLPSGEKEIYHISHKPLQGILNGNKE